MTDQEIAARITYWWTQLNKVHGTNYAEPQVDISDRLTTQAGVCKKRAGIVTVTLYDWAIKSQGQKYDEMIAHELAHAHNFMMYDNCSAHGTEWKRAMLWIGLEPKRCHTYDVPNNKKLNCKCGKVLNFGPRVLNKMVKYKQRRYCLKCKTGIIVVNGELKFEDYKSTLIAACNR